MQRAPGGCLKSIHYLTVRWMLLISVYHLKRARSHDNNPLIQRHFFSISVAGATVSASCIYCLQIDAAPRGIMILEFFPSPFSSRTPSRRHLICSLSSVIQWRPEVRYSSDIFPLMPGDIPCPVLFPFLSHPFIWTENLDTRLRRQTRSGARPK